MIESNLLGLGLAEMRYKNSLRVIVKDVKANADEVVKQLVKPGMILVSVQGMNVEGLPGKRVVEEVKTVLQM